MAYESEESASSHREQSTRVTLVAAGDKVELVIRTRDHSAFNGHCENGGTRYSISVERLIEFIRKNGKSLQLGKPEQNAT